MKKWLALLLLCALICPGALAKGPQIALQMGSRGTDVQRLLVRLSELGLYWAPIDEVFGRQADLAVKRYQGLIGAEADGRLTRDQQNRLMDLDAALPIEPMKQGDAGEPVRRLQIRLDMLGYLHAPIASEYTMRTASAVRWFQRENAIPQTGEADEYTQWLLFSSRCVAPDVPAHRYRLFISNSDQRVFAYEWDGEGYNVRVLSAVCSTGLPNTPTPDGIFRADGPVSRWCYFPIYGCWAQYAWRIEGAVLFHSVLYARADESTLRHSSVKSLGSKSSHGCVRMTVEDAKWIYDHCRRGTAVVVY